VQTKEIEKEKKKWEGKESKKCMGHNGGKQLTLKVGRKKVSMVMLKVQREEHDLKPYTQIEL